MKKIKNIILIVFSLIFMLLLLTGCGSNIDKTNAIVDNNYIDYKIDYSTAEEIEKDLNSGVDVIGKIVKFKVKAYGDSRFGKNAQSGEHLNFISNDDPQLNINDEVICVVKKTDSFIGTWLLNYEIIEIVKNNTNNEIKNEVLGNTVDESNKNTVKELNNSVSQVENTIISDDSKTTQSEDKVENSNVSEKEKNTTTKKESTSSVQTPASVNNSSTVYVSRTGTKYHSIPNCGRTKDPLVMTITEAQAMGKQACSTCY